MSEIEQLTKELADKLTILSLSSEEAQQSLVKNRRREIQRHLSEFEKEIEEYCNLKNKLRAQKLKSETVDVEDVKEWSKKVAEDLILYEDFMENLQQAIEKYDEEKENESRKKKCDNDEKILAELKATIPKATYSNLPIVKLPKLTITKFNGTYTDWVRFWGQFEVEIDRPDVPHVTKFSYLKELLSQNVRLLVDGLPFNAEGYERAKVILRSKFGKTSEIVNAHIKIIMDLPTITGSPARKIL